MRLRPASVSLTIEPTSWRAPRPPTPRRATFPLPETKSTCTPLDAEFPPVPPLSYWSPDTPSPFSPQHPSSPINPFLIPPQPQSLFNIASPLLPSSPLSIFDIAMSPGFVVSPMESTCVVDMEYSPVSPIFSSSVTPTSPVARQTLLVLPTSPLSPRFLDPRTPPVPCTLKVKLRQETLDVQGNLGQEHLIQHMLGDIRDRKASIASVLTMGQERMRMRINFYQWLAVRRWEGMEEKEKSGWKLWGKNITEKDSKEGIRKVFKMLKDVVMCF